MERRAEGARRWAEEAVRRGEVCPAFARRVAAAETAWDMYMVMCDPAAAEWLMARHAADPASVPAALAAAWFPWTRGDSRAAAYPGGFTSKAYCLRGGDAEADATVVCLLECAGMRLRVPDNAFARIVMSRGSSAEVCLGEGARAVAELHGDAEARLAGGDPAAWEEVRK